MRDRSRMAHAAAIDHVRGGGSRRRRRGRRERARPVVDRLIAFLANRQHGVVSRGQLLAAGIGRRAIEHRLATGRLHAIYPGVYAAGHRVLTPEGRWMAGVLAAGPDAVLSHRAAGALWRLLRWPHAVPEVTVPRSLRSREGLRVHRSRLPADEVTEVDGIPTTTVPRTLLDLATVLDRHRLERAINEAEVLQLTDQLSLPDLLERYPRRHGTRALREILADSRLGLEVTRSELESRFLRFLAEAGLPRPQTNALLPVGQEVFEVDCVWRRCGVVVELDGRTVHDTARAFERDRARDRALSAAGWRVVRVTWRQLASEPRTLATDLRKLLESPASHRSARAWDRPHSKGRIATG